MSDELAAEHHYRIARKITANERLTEEDTAELRRNLQAVVEEMRGIFMRERRWE